MKLPKIFPIASNRGFTLVEILVAIGIFLLILGIGIIFGIDDYQRYIFRKERDTVLTTLMKARSRAMNNFDQKSHGVHIEADKFTLFRGTDFSTSDPATREVIPGSAAVAKTGAADVIFKQLSGEPTGAASITLQNGTSNVTVTINNEGRIDW